MKQELIDWMDAKDLTAQDFAERLGVQAQTVRNWRSAGVPERKVDHVRAVMAQWDSHPSSRLGALVVRATAMQFRQWNRAALDRGMLMEDWAAEALDEMARETPLLRVAEDPADYRVRNRGEGAEDESLGRQAAEDALEAAEGD